METIQTYFETIPSWHRSLILAAGLFFFYVLEFRFPYLKMSYKKITHAGLNIFFTITSAIVNFALAFLMVWACDLVVNNKVGLLYIFKMPLWAFVLLGLLLLDLIGAWLVHFIQHKIKWMWKFHLIHHADMHVDASTANRHHPGESVFRFLFTILAILVTGAPVWLVMLYQSLSVLISQFNHANIDLGEKADALLSLIIVSPDMHKVHHHFVQPYTDSNYANIFSIWDRLFGTFRSMPKKDIIYGIDTHMEKQETENIRELFTIPFQPYRAPTGSKFEDHSSFDLP